MAAARLSWSKPGSVGLQSRPRPHPQQRQRSRLPPHPQRQESPNPQRPRWMQPGRTFQAASWKRVAVRWRKQTPARRLIASAARKNHASGPKKPPSGLPSARRRSANRLRRKPPRNVRVWKKLRNRRHRNPAPESRMPAKTPSPRNSSRSNASGPKSPKSRHGRRARTTAAAQN